MADYRELVIADLAESEARLSDVIFERDAYREAWHVAVHEHHETRREVESLRRQLAWLREENRRQREQMLASDRTAA